MSLISIVFVNEHPCTAFWSIEHATAYAQRTAPHVRSLAIRLAQLDLVPWENTLCAWTTNGVWTFDGETTTQPDIDPPYTLPLV